MQSNKKRLYIYIYIYNKTTQVTIHSWDVLNIKNLYGAFRVTSPDTVNQKESTVGMCFRVPGKFYRRNGLNGTNAIWDSWARKPRRRRSVWDAKESQFALDYFPDTPCVRDRPTNRPYRAGERDSIRTGRYCWPELTLSSGSERNSKFALTGRARAREIIPSFPPFSSLLPPLLFPNSFSLSFSLCYSSQSVCFIPSLGSMLPVKSERQLRQLEKRRDNAQGALFTANRKTRILVTFIP